MVLLPGLIDNFIQQEQTTGGENLEMEKSMKKRVLSAATKVILSTTLLTPVFVTGGGVGTSGVAAATTASVTLEDQIASFALSLKGKPYLKDGASPQGFSGPGFVQYVYKQYGVSLPATIDQLSRSGQAVTFSQLRMGDLVFLSEKNSSQLEHVGIYVGNNEFIVSAPGTDGVRVHTFEKEVLKERFSTARRILTDRQTEIEIGQLPGSEGLSTVEKRFMNTIDAVLGKPYGKGEAGPIYFDGPGLVEYAYEQNGVSMPSTLSEMAKKGTSVSRDQLKLGDVIFFGTSQSNLLSAAIYVGDNKIAIASQEIGQVVVRDLGGVYDRYYLGAKRMVGGSEQTVDRREELADKIIATGLKYWGTPYKYGAEYPTSGKFDCSSFTQWIFDKNGIKLPRSSRQQSQVGTYVSRSKLEKGDLVFFSTSYSDGKIAHVGVYVGDGKFLHTYGKPGVTYSSLDSKWWDSHYITARRVIK